MNVIERIEKIKSIGNQRFLYSKQWQATKEYLIELAKDNDLEVREDVLGNVFIRLEGYENKKVIGIISHYDSVENSSAYDGIVGIISGIETLIQLKENYGKPDISVEVICVCDKEGARFKTTFIGSRAVIGELDYDNIKELRDEDGVSFIEAREALGYEPLCQKSLDYCYRDDLISCVQLHIEQGKFLEKTKTPIGVVDQIPGRMKVKMTIIGEISHEGATSMFERKDALCCAAKIISFVEHLGIKYDGITRTEYSINATNGTKIVPSKVELIHDLRHHDKKTFHQMLLDLQSYAKNQEEKRGVRVSFEKMVAVMPAEMNEQIIDTIHKTAGSMDLKHMTLKSQAGHDVQIMAGTGMPSGLIFIPRIEEFGLHQDGPILDQNIEKGILVLTEVVKKMAYLAM